MVSYNTVKSHYNTDQYNMVLHTAQYWQRYGINSLNPGGFWKKSWQVIFKLILVIDGWGVVNEIALRWLLLNFIDDESTLVQVMAWCQQATREREIKFIGLFGDKPMLIWCHQATMS